MDFPALPLDDLTDAFRQRAALLAAHAPSSALAFEEAASWLEKCLEAHLNETMSIAAAAREAGWSYEGLRRRVAGDRRLNAGTPRNPRIRRRDLLALGPGRGSRPTTARARQPEPAPAAGIHIRDAHAVKPTALPAGPGDAPGADRRRRSGAAAGTRRPAATIHHPEDADPMDSAFSRILDRAVNT